MFPTKVEEKHETHLYSEYIFSRKSYDFRESQTKKKKKKKIERAYKSYYDVYTILIFYNKIYFTCNII
jgi:hypothetical protein